jgi:thioredoxin reductase
MFDVVIAGGGPAGLSAALMLGRCRRSVLLCDTGHPRNRHSGALHGYLTRDGIAPADFLAHARADIEKYGIHIRHVGVDNAQRIDNGFEVTLADGARERSRFLLIATGVVDDLPRIDGFDACYGRSIFHCPYCDGWEWRDRPLAAFGRGVHGGALALSLKTWSADVVLCTNGSRVPPSARARLDRNEISIRAERVVRVEHTDGVLTSIVFEHGSAERRDALFFSSPQHPQCDIAVNLGCLFNNRGTVNTGNMCETNVPGVFVAGDASRDAQFVIVAAAEGAKAAIAINQALQKENLRG